MTADDIIGLVVWLTLGLAYAWAVWNLARPRRDAPGSGPPSDASKVVELHARHGLHREPGAEPERRVEQEDDRRLHTAGASIDHSAEHPETIVRSTPATSPLHDARSACGTMKCHQGRPDPESEHAPGRTPVAWFMPSSSGPTEIGGSMNLTIWLPVMFLLGLGGMGICLAFLAACERI
jgi:hypothetical protein